MLTIFGRDVSGFKTSLTDIDWGEDYPKSANCGISCYFSEAFGAANSQRWNNGS